MSFILDALRKSERERKRAKVPDPLAIQEPLLPAKKSRFARSSFIMAALLLSALASGLWFGIWYGKNPELNEIENNAAPQPIQIPNTPKDTGESIKEQQPAAGRESDDTGKSARSIANLPEQRKKDMHFMRSGKEKSFDTTAITPAKTVSLPAAEIEIPTPDKNRLYSFQELPVLVRQKLPNFSFSVFLYTDEPSSRRVRVNGVMMKEGQYLADGLKLDEISADGAIFSYMNYRFHVAMP